MQDDDEKSLEIVKQIISGENAKKLKEFEDEIKNLKFQFNDKEKKIAAYYPIITDLLERKIIDSEEEVSKVLSLVMGKAIKKKITDAKDEVIDALYPIMGETIKKSIAEAMKDFYKSINLKIDNALKKGIFSKKIKSTISGVSTSDLILQSSFPFNIKEIFLIHESSGILITHISSSTNKITADADIVSGMLTAIKDFVQETFKADSDSTNLYEIQYGDSRIILDRGRYIYFAIVISGQEPVEFNDKLSELKIYLHKKYSNKFKKFNGETGKFKDIDKPILKFMNSFIEKNDSLETEKPKPVLLYLLAFIFIFFLVIYSIIKIPAYFKDQSTNEIIKTKLESIPQLDLKNISWQSESGEVTLSGIINSYEMKNKIINELKSIPEVTKINNKLGIIFPVFSADSITAGIKKSLSNFELNKDYKITYQVNEDVVIVDGEIGTIEHKRNIGFVLSQVPGVRVVINNLKILDSIHKSELDIIQQLSNIKLYFDFGKIELNENHIEQLKPIISYLQNNSNISLVIKGFSDGEANNSNLTIAKKRAKSVADYLISNKVDPKILIIQSFISNIYNYNTQSGISDRRVEFEIK